MKQLVLFSSDSHDLYREDIFKAVCLPKGYVLHFRYGRDDVDNDVLKDLPSFENDPKNKALIYFATGNTLDIPAHARRITHVPVRKVKILKIEETQNTGLIHFYLRMEDFFGDMLGTTVSTDNSPPGKYAALIETSAGMTETTVNWTEAVDRVKSSFPKQNFVSVKLKSRSDREISPKYDSDLFESYYQLNSEESYVFDVSYYQLERSRDLISVKVGGAPLSIDTSDSERMGNVRDNRRFGLNIGEISAKEVTSFVTFSPTLSQDNPISDGFEVLLKLRLKRNYLKSLQFGVLSSLLLLLPALKVIKDDTLLAKLSWCTLVIGVALGFAGSSFVIAQLHHLFNKK